MSTYCVDSSVFITAWYKQYPPRIFKPLWDLIAQHNEKLVLLKPIFDEIEPMTSDDRKRPLKLKQERFALRLWLETNRFPVMEVSHDMNCESLRLEKEYQIRNFGKGANQNDVMLIACAKLLDMTVVTFEEVQTTLPAEKRRYKIPAICNEQNVRCIDFVTMLDELNIEIV